MNIHQLSIKFVADNEAGNFGDIAKFFHENIVFCMLDGTEVSGVDNVIKTLQELMSGPMGKMSFELLSVIADEDAHISTVYWRAVHKDKDGNAMFSWLGNDILTWRDSKIVRKDTFGKCDAPKIVPS
ncbi:MAG: nuclear transport factor 2 family protein [Robiginitomaculum sp.]